MRKPRLGLKKSESEGRGWVKDVDTKIPSKLLLTTAPTLVSGIYFAYRVTPKKYNIFRCRYLGSIISINKLGCASVKLLV